MEFKQNKYLPAEKQVVTADPDVTSVSIALCIMHYKEDKTCSCLFSVLFAILIKKNISVGNI